MKKTTILAGVLITVLAISGLSSSAAAAPEKATPTPVHRKHRHTPTPVATATRTPQPFTGYTILSVPVLPLAPAPGSCMPTCSAEMKLLQEWLAAR